MERAPVGLTRSSPPLFNAVFYTKYACGGRHLFLYMLLVSKTLKELRNSPRTPPKGTVYLFEKGNPNDVSVTLGKIASVSRTVQTYTMEQTAHALGP